MQVDETELPGVYVLTPRAFGDERGFFAETWNARTLADAGLGRDWVQDNQSVSRQIGTLRGMHFQAPPHAQAKLVRCGHGVIYDVAVDIRVGSPTYGKWTGVELSAENRKQLFVPEGFAHGFITRSDDCEVLYKASSLYNRDSEGVLRWDCATVGIDWGVAASEVFLNDRDAQAVSLDDLDSPFVYEGAS